MDIQHGVSRLTLLAPHPVSLVVTEAACGSHLPYTALNELDFASATSNLVEDIF